MDEDTFWDLIAQLDWDKTGDDAAVVRPVLRALVEREPDEILEFQEILAEKLHALDGRRWARESGDDVWWGEPDKLSVDEFLYTRCAVVANGREVYEGVLRDPSDMPKDREFEALLYIARDAWEERTGREYDHDTRVSYETFSNERGWQEN